MKYQRSTIVIVALMVALLLVGAATVWLVAQRNAASELRDSTAGTALTQREAKAPYTNLAGETQLLSDYVGRVLVVHSWASWCVQCDADLATLESLAQEFNENELVVLAINRAEPAATAERYLQRSIGTDTAVQLILDPDDNFYTSVAGYAMPETVVFNPKGEEIYRYRTALSRDELVAQISRLLEE